MNNTNASASSSTLATTNSPAQTPVIQTQQRNNVLVVTINNPPVNALSSEVRRQLQAAIIAANSDQNVKAILLIGANNNFIAGADIREFGKPPAPPQLPDVCLEIEQSQKLIAVCIDGAALGGGLEIAMSAHFRLATNRSKLGLPEVLLGLLPGAGGTQRAPRLMGVVAALDLMLSGRHISADEALKAGLIDTLLNDASTDALIEQAIQVITNLLNQRAPIRRTGDLPTPTPIDVAQQYIAQITEQTKTKSALLFSPHKIIEAVTAATTRPFNDGLKIERQLFVACLDSPQSAGLIHAFFTDRQVSKVPEATLGTARPLQHIGVIGGGTMGSGIAVALLDAKFKVTMIERDAAALTLGMNRINNVYDGLIAKNRLTTDAKKLILDNLQGSTSYDALAQVDCVIEAAFEDIEVKKSIFKELDKVCKTGAILATNTSYLDINAIAAVTKRPADVLGLHFFSPANIMKLLEIVVPAQVGANAVATAFALAKRCKKIAVRAGVCDGFIGNRILATYKKAADYMMADGASPYQIDAAIRAFGYPMGIFQVSDLAGGDIGWATRKRLQATRNPNERYVHIADRLCEQGWFGQKTGRGFYLYPNGARTGTPDPEVLQIIDVERQRANITPRTFSDDEIMRRYMAAMINEAANVVHEKIALRPLDVDATLLYGYGFPRFRGGPMHYADQIGLATVLADIQEFAQEDAHFWQPSALLIELVQQGKKLSDLN